MVFVTAFARAGNRVAAISQTSINGNYVQFNEKRCRVTTQLATAIELGATGNASPDRDSVGRRVGPPPGRS